MLPREQSRKQSGTDHGIDADGQFLAGRCLLRGAGNGQKWTLLVQNPFFTREKQSSCSFHSLMPGESRADVL